VVADYRGRMSLLDEAESLPLIRAEPGEVLIHQDTHVGRLLVLVEGAVQVERDGVPVVRVSEPGAVFGEMSLVLRTPATATVRCLRPSTFRVADDPMAFLTSHPGAALEMLRVSAGRVDALTRYLVDVKQQYADQDDHLGMLDTVLDVLANQQVPRARPGSVRDPR
jgi:CRP/FNR family transcriptional regulator, cyclic AMP receptor protein